MTAEPPADDSAETPSTPPVPLLELRESLPAVVETEPGLEAAIAAIAAGTGPIAVDAERASGYRYSQRAYLVQVRRRGAGTVLIDPIAFGDLTPLDAVIADHEWILHAASQDLGCLADVGLRPRTLFDTELAGRLLALPRVGLAAIVEELLGYRLRKEHSAVDWSTRPLPRPWLEYAALDVEALIELREVIGNRLADEGRLGWAEEEFAALVVRRPNDRHSEPRSDPWRRTSGIHRVRGRRSLAAVKAMWETRDEIARGRDITPGRVLPDAAIVEAAIALPRSRQALAVLGGFKGRGAQRYLRQFAEAITAARQLDEHDLPQVAARYSGPPPAKAWADRDPVAAARLAAARAAVGQIAEQHRLPVENLLAPDSVRRLCWDPPNPLDADVVAAFLREQGAREWQIGLTTSALAAALTS